MKRIIISDFVNWELDKFRHECNFTNEELEFFNLRAQGITISEASEMMNISQGKADKLSKKVINKIIRVI